MNREFDNILDSAKKLHFVGIGGAGMCPLAEILHGKGYAVTGSDMFESDNTERLRSLGITVYSGHDAKNAEGADALIHTAAVHADNPELVYARQHGIPVIERSILLGIISRRFDNTIAVCGTHGKTTTTSMISHVLYAAKKDPTIVIGGRLPSIGSTGRSGGSDTMVCEACEYVDTFLQIEPNVAVILNIDEDHLDYFKTLENIIRSFNRFANQTKSSVIVNGDDENSMKALSGVKKRIITFGLEKKNDYYAENIQVKNGSYYSYDLMKKGEKLCRIELGVPGIHNVSNSLGACAALINAGVTPEETAALLPTFTGAGRRFEIYGTYEGVTVIDDFAHHPHEIDATLEAAFGQFSSHTPTRVRKYFSTNLCGRCRERIGSFSPKSRRQERKTSGAFIPRRWPKSSTTQS